MSVTLYKIGGVHFRLLGTNGFHVKAKKERFTAASSRCRQNIKYENFTLSFRRLRQNIAPKACCTCSTISFLRSTNEVIVNFWRCRCRWRRPVGRGVLSAEWVMIISYLASPSRVIVSLKPQLHIIENLDKLKRVKERNGASEKTEKKRESFVDQNRSV